MTTVPKTTERKTTDLSRRTLVKSLAGGSLGLLAAGPSNLASAAPAPNPVRGDTQPDELIGYDALGLATLIRRGEVSPAELVEVLIRRIEAIDPVVNCIATPAFERARERASAISKETLFAGVPILIKDMIDVGGLRRSDGSRLQATHIPQKSVAYTAAIEAAGLNIAGATTVPEFASGLESELYGQTRNPWNLGYSCLASSSGAGAAVAAGYLPLVHGTDGGGSNRLPSHACGVFGFKPTRGRMLSGEADGGHDRFKTNGAISRTVRDSAALFSATEDRSSELYEPVGQLTGPSKQRLRIAYAPAGVRNLTPTVASIREAQDDVAKLLGELGHRVETIVHPVDGEEFFTHFRWAFLPKFRPLLDLVTGITGRAPVDSGLLTRWTATMIESGRDFTQEEIEKGKAYFDNVVEGLFARVFNEFDVLLTPVSPLETPKLGDIRPTDHWEEKGHLFELVMSLTAPVNPVGDCAMSAPLSVSKATGMPVGSMFHAPAGKDRVLYELAYELEEARPWKDRWAPYSARHIPV